MVTYESPIIDSDSARDRIPEPDGSSDRAHYSDLGGQYDHALEELHDESHDNITNMEGNQIEDAAPQVAGGTPVEIPAWLQQVLNHQQHVMNAQYQQMMQTIQQQNQRIDRLTQGTPAVATPPTANTTTPSSGHTGAPGLDVALFGKRPRAKLPDPEEFDGKDKSLFPQWEGKLHAKLTIDKTAIGDIESDLIWYGFNRLKGDAAAQIFPWISTYKDSPTFTLDAFYKQLKIVFEDQALQEKALTRLHSLCQGSRSIDELLADLDRLLLEAGGHGWEDRIKKGYLRQAVNNALRDKMVSMEEKPTFDEYRNQVKSIADKMAEAKRLSNNSTRYPAVPRTNNIHTTGTTSAIPNASNGETMDWEPSASRLAKRAKWVPKEELDRRMKEKLCLRCGAAGHRIHQCPFRAALRPHEVKVSAVGITDAVLEDDETPKERKETPEAGKD